MHLLITRPEPEAGRWAAALAADGLPAVALPLMRIEPLPLQGALRTARQRLGDYHAAMFVSGQAVAAFFQAESGLAPAGIADAAIKTRAWSPGPGTSAALLRAGWPPARLDEPPADAARFDSEALWERVKSQLPAKIHAKVHAQVHTQVPPHAPPVRVLIVRGGGTAGRPEGRDWIARQLRAAGAHVDEVMAYRRQPPDWSAAQRALAAQAAADGSVWLLSSSQAIAHLRLCLPAQDWRRARALATHPRIAQAAQALGFGQVLPTQPTLAAVQASARALLNGQPRG